MRSKSRPGGYRPIFNALLLLALFCPPALSMPGDEPDIQSGDSRYLRTVQALQQSSPLIRTDFASINLSQLVEAYIAEADLARNQAEKEGGNAKLSGWSRAVDQYASQLLLVLEDIELGFPAELSRSRDGTVRVTVGGRLLILSHPRADQQASFERQVLLDFCVRHDCQVLTAQSIQQEPIPLSASQVEAQWTFGEDGPVCSHDGIELRFANVQNLARSRGICGQLLEEALTLASEIAWQQRHGVVVQWSTLHIRPTPQRPEHLVQLNAAGDTILATLPLLYRSPRLLQDLQPWIKTRFAGGKRVTLQLQAGRYGWEGPGD